MWPAMGLEDEGRAGLMMRTVVVVLALVCSSCTTSPGSGASHATAIATPTATTSPRVSGPPIRLSTLRGRLAFDCGGDVCVANIDGSGRRDLTRRAGPEFDPTWSPDGSRVAYRDSRTGINRNDEIYVVDVDGSGRRNLTRNLSNDWGPAWSPDGRLIAFNSDQRYGQRLYVMRPDGSGVRQVSHIEGEYPAWSPDSRRLAFMSQRPGAVGLDPNYDVFVVNLDGSGLRQLTDWPGEDGWPSWSPDGRWIAFTTTHDDAGQFRGGGPYRDIYVMRPDGTGKRRVVRGLYAGFPVWSPDGRTILFSGGPISGSRSGLWVVRPDGSGARPLPVHSDLADWIAG